MFGSRLAVGALDPGTILDRRDQAGVTLREALQSVGIQPELLGLDAAALERIGVFVELHIEQGSLLGRLDQPLGVAAAIKPHGRWRVDLVGEANHSGMADTAVRRDPMLALAELLQAARRAADDEHALVTVGKLRVWPNSSNSIAERVRAWLDVRSDEESTLEHVVARVTRSVEAIAGKHRIDIQVRCESQVPRVLFSESLRSDIVETLTGFDLDIVQMDTGAGHDVGALAADRPTAMLFVRNTSGISHSGDEAAAAPDDCLTGIGALTTVLAELARHTERRPAPRALPPRPGGDNA